MSRLAVQLAGIELKNPIIPASGCFGYGREYADYYELDRLGAITVKAVTSHRRLGNPTPRIAEVEGGMLNSIGLANPGVDWVINQELPWLKRFDVPVIVNVAGESIADYAETTAKIAHSGLAAAVELNVSCPNVAKGGIAYGNDPQLLRELVKAVRRVCTIPLIIKLSPNVADIRPFARIAQEEGADALSLINTLIGMKIDVDRRQPILARKIGGLSGPAIRPVAVRMVYEAAQAVDIPIIGMGGVTCGRDALEFIMAGASAVGVGTAIFTDPYACLQIIAELEEWMAENDVTSLEEIRGCVR